MEMVCYVSEGSFDLGDGGRIKGGEVGLSFGFLCMVFICYD